MIFPGAKDYLQEVLQTPRHDSSLNDKLVHNNKVYHFFKEQGVLYNANHLLRSKDAQTAAPKIDCAKNLSQISSIRLEKLRTSLHMDKVVNRLNAGRTERR